MGIKQLSPLGKCIRKLRVDTDCNQGDLAQSIGVSKAYVSAVEQGSRTPSEEMLFRIKHFFEGKGAPSTDEIEIAYFHSLPKISIDLTKCGEEFKNRLLVMLLSENVFLSGSAIKQGGRDSRSDKGGKNKGGF